MKSATLVRPRRFPAINFARLFATFLFVLTILLIGLGVALWAGIRFRPPHISFIQGSVVRARPIAVLFLEDEAGGDEKLLTVPVDTTFPYYADVMERQDLPSIVMQQIEHFFTHYKDLEAEKWVRVGHWGGAEDARRVVLEAIERAR